MGTVNRKKVIAREFLVIIACLVITGLSFPILKFHNHNQNKKYNVANDNLENNVYSKKINAQNIFFDGFAKEFDLKYNGEYNRFRDALWRSLATDVENDSINYKWMSNKKPKFITFVKNTGIANAEGFKKFLLDNTISKTEIKKQEAQVDKLHYEKAQILSPEEINELLLKIFVISIIVLFLLRYIFYGIVWSVKTLKS